MAGVIAGAFLITLAVIAAGVAVYIMATTTRPPAVALIMCLPLMLLAFILVTAGGVLTSA